MNEPAPPLSGASAESLSTRRTLHRLFLTLFLRGRSARGLSKEGAPKSVMAKLWMTLGFYGLLGLLALFMMGQPVFALAAYLHGMSFFFLGLFVASSAGEVLFNREEGDILLYRPVTVRALLWAKISVMVQVSLWMAGAFSLVGLMVGVFAPDGGWLFPIVHAASTALEALFCAACVVMVYQLCLKWFGRERLDSLMTTAQVLMTVLLVLGSQMMPQLMGRYGSQFDAAVHLWWVSVLPPAWFAGLDDALAGSGRLGSWIAGGVGLAVTALLVWLAFGKLAGSYGTGLQALSETVSKARGGRQRWLDRIVHAPPLSWWLQNSVTRAAFLLTAAYLIRDRDVKLRVYPGLAPLMVFPFIFLLRDFGGASGFGIAFASGYLGMIPLLAINLLQYSQQWQASDIFRAAPIQGPALICAGTRRAVLVFLALPFIFCFMLLAWLATRDPSRLPLFLTGLIGLPIYAAVPNLGGKGVPLSLPMEEAKSTGRGLTMLVVMLISAALSGIATFAYVTGWFGGFLVGEALVALTLFAAMQPSLRAARWSALE